MGSLRDKYEKNFLLYDLIASVIITGLIFLIAIRTPLNSKILELLVGIRLSLYNTIISVAGALIGFVITGLSILISMKETPSLELLKKSKYYKQIYDVYLSTSRCLGMLLFIALFAIILDHDNKPIPIMPYIILWGLMISTLRIARCLWVIKNIIGLITKK
ncbi:hypothetical protein MTHERMOG20_11540 [Moorella thermoacetica]|uniref:Uncharacterized protein n=1 Tax=Moorella thermoacetica (strain ATCC 39073 / JCM 9320) TaxID=264732 RepID=Q2RHX0_MOOTA|nr:hypothetical protein [Moorella thermoacetica]AKX94467.1 hypothetical protein MOTHE_c16740 [Moorella thermoacetica]AKX97103.1 hypothetical protein MOTHA_c17570 [Moorella thermoacetica]OIQ57478.1 hypothetical protein MOCA_10680 [Moorella thermoacetica]QDA00933.1 hypothetical protein MothHH_01794 [Moorella thermoacetica]TYL10090.1 hypothetical protein MOOCA_06890 [Moorella thermoacetica]